MPRTGRMPLGPCSSLLPSSGVHGSQLLQGPNGILPVLGIHCRLCLLDQRVHVSGFLVLLLDLLNLLLGVLRSRRLSGRALPAFASLLRAAAAGLRLADVNLQVRHHGIVGRSYGILLLEQLFPARTGDLDLVLAV